MRRGIKLELKFIATTNETFENVRFAGHDATKDIKTGFGRNEKLGKKILRFAESRLPGWFRSIFTRNGW